MSAHAGQPSRKAQELAEHLKQALADYRARDAKVSEQDVQMALTLLSPSRPGQARVALAVLAGIVGAFVGVGLLVAGSKGRIAGGASASIIYMTIALAIAGAVIGVLLKDRSD